MSGYWESVCGYRSMMNDDERQVFDEAACTLARKLMGEGREEYGPLSLATDARDFLDEAADEMGDALVWLFMHLVQRKRDG